jgi:hypothetical protein
MRRFLLLSLAVVLIGLAGCSQRPSEPSPRPLASGESAQIGLQYAVTVLTHCGLRHVAFDGSTWAIEGVLDDGSMNPPDGFGNPEDHGSVVLQSHDTGTYRSEQGVERKLTRGGGLPQVEGCV